MENTISPFKQSIIVFYKTREELNQIIDYLTEKDCGEPVATTGKEWGQVAFNDGSIIRLFDIKNCCILHNPRWTSIMVTSGCTKEDIENLNKSTLLGFIYGSYANENIMRIKEPQNIFSGACPVKYER